MRKIRPGESRNRTHVVMDPRLSDLACLGLKTEKRREILGPRSNFLSKKPHRCEYSF